jgi:antitoxin (DNA-binding transcriptional repressor) of toxin-antitoxin stability system
MSDHNIAESGANLTNLIDRALVGEAVVITRDGKPVAELRPVLHVENSTLGETPKRCSPGCAKAAHPFAKTQMKMRAHSSAACATKSGIADTWSICLSGHKHRHPY